MAERGAPHVPGMCQNTRRRRRKKAIRPWCPRFASWMGVAFAVKRLRPRNPQGFRGHMERNTGFEPATFALATRQPGIDESSLPSTNQQEPVMSLRLSAGEPEPSSTNLHAASHASCAQDVPPTARVRTSPSIDIAQLAALLGCSSAHVYKLCEQGKLPHFRDLHNAIWFDCMAVGYVLRSAIFKDHSPKP